MLYSHQQWRDAIAEKDNAYSVGFLGYAGGTLNPALLLIAACSSNRTGNLQPAASTGEQLTAA